MSKLNTFQLKGLRKILGVKTTYVERANTNNKVFEKASRYKNPKHIPGKDVKTFSEYAHTQQNKLLAHIVRSDASDPLRQCTLAAGTPYPYKLFNKRVGRPRSYWTRATYERLINTNMVTNNNTLKTHPNLYIDQLLPAITGRTAKT